MSDGAKEQDGAPPAPWLSITIQPDPEAEERDALIAAVTAFLAAQPAPGPAEEPAPERSRWLEAGRTVAVRGVKKGPHMGWGRGRAGWR